MGILQTMGGGGGSLQVSASNVSGNSSGFIHCGNPGATGIPNTSVAGGSGNYHFSWERVGAAATFGPWDCSNTAIQNPVWLAPDPVCADAVTINETWQVTATDNSSGQIGKASILVNLFWTDLR